VVLAAFAAYHNSFSGPFIFDDKPVILENSTIRHLWSALLPPPGGMTVSGRPMLNLSLAINYALGGTDVGTYHALNLAIHVLAGLALLGIVRRTLLRPALRERFGAAALPLALAVAVLWIVHPLQTQAVTYVVQRAESLMGLFYLLTLYCFVRSVDQGRSVFWPLAAVACCLLGMATKEVMVSAPLMVLLYDRTFGAGSFREACRQRWRLYLGLAATWLLLGYLVFSTGGNRGGTAGFNVGVSWWAYALTQFEAVAHYLRLSFWPHPLVFEYGTFWVQRAGEVAPAAIIVVLLVAGTVIALWRWPAIGFLGAWFFAMLAPTSLVPGTLQMIVEYRMYLSLAAVIVPIVLGLYLLAGRKSAVVFLALAAGLGWATARRNEDYRSAVAIWADTTAKRPDNPIAHNNLGNALREDGRLTEAMAHYQEALRLKSDYPEAHNNLGIALEKMRQTPEAMAEYETALRLKPDYPEAHNNLGVALAGQRRLPEAIAHFEAALQLNPDYAGAHNSLGIALASQGRLPEAIAHFEAAVRLKPDYPEAQNNLGIALMNSPGRLSEAMVHFEAALRLKPGIEPAQQAVEQWQAAQR
jgi:tetratricopeptide (TPR) repeat protein